MDAESLQKRAARRGGCLDAFLVTSVLLLFAAVTVVAVGGLVAVRELRARAEDGGTAAALKGRKAAAPAAYKMQNFAYLEFISSALVQNRTMSWAPVQYGLTDSVGSSFDFHQAHHALTLKRTGSYFMYVDLRFSCTSVCKAGLVTASLGRGLTCEVSLPEGFRPVSRRCWAVSRMAADTVLMGDMSVPGKGLQNWKLDRDSAFGIFLVG